LIPFGVVVALAIGIPVAFAGMGDSAFLPHAFCYLNNARLTWTHVISDSLIALSYLSISATLLFIVRKSQGSIPFHWLILAFGLFIVACGGTHAMEVLTVWRPYYWLSASIKVVTAGASVATAISLPLVTPMILNRLDSAERSEERRQGLEHANAELHRLNQELREYDTLKNTLMTRQSARIGAWEWNMRTGENKWSEPVEIMHGLQPGTYDGRYESWWATVHPDDRHVVEEAIGQASKTGLYDVEYRTIRSQGSVYWTAARGHILPGADGTPERMLGICMDVTVRKENEATLLRAEKLAAAGRMAATVAHEINNPLEAVMNLLYIARTTDGDPKDLLELADRELSRVASITRQTLGFYRDNSLPTEVSPSSVIDEVVMLYNSKAVAKDIKLVKVVQAEPTIHVVRGEFHQVIANVLSNAIDASPRTGTITVKLTVSEDGGARIDVEDDGPGIPNEVATRLFEPFFTTKKDVGTGLGLWVSRQIMERMGGSISFAARTSGPGTCFSVYLPRPRAAASAD
jgi:PAS domain S-box-containing protein